MLMPCPNHSLCIDPQNPSSNFSSEDPDRFEYFGQNWSFTDPLIHSQWQASSCKGQCTSDISQEDADLCAMRLAQTDCTDTNKFYNTDQSCTQECAPTGQSPRAGSNSRQGGGDARSGGGNVRG